MSGLFHMRALGLVLDQLGGVGSSRTVLEGDLSLLEVRSVGLGSEESENHHPCNDDSDEDTLDRRVVGSGSSRKLKGSSCIGLDLGGTG